MKLETPVNHRRHIICSNCKKEKEHHAKELCHTCYKKIAWKAPMIKCKHCGRERHHKAKGLCASCHVKVHHYEKTQIAGYLKYKGLTLEKYQKITSKCLICGFDKLVDLHHLDHNKQNNSDKNVVGLCPNHHRMIHDYKNSKEVCDVLKSKGYNPKVKEF